MGKELRRVARDIGEVEINEKYTCFFMTLNGVHGIKTGGFERAGCGGCMRGCGYLVVLRLEGFRYRLVGAWYLAGFMFGEFWKERRGNRVGEETFETC